MEIVPVAKESERVFWNHVNRDPINYYFFIMDWTQNREQTKIFLAIEGEEVLGSLLVFADSVVQFRGSREAVQKLIECVKFDKVELQAPPDCEDVICQRFKPRIKEYMLLMRLNRGEEHHIHSAEPLTRLNVEDADKVASRLRRCDPEWWGRSRRSS